MLRGVNQMLGVCWLPYQPSHAFDDVSSPVFNRELVIVIPFHILESVYFPLPESQIILDARHELLAAIPVFEAWKMQRGVFFVQYFVIVRLHALLPDPTLDIFVLFTHRKHIVGIVLEVRLKETLSIVFPWHSNVIAQQSTGAGVGFRPRQRRWRWLRLRVCDVFKILDVGKCIQVFD